METTIQTNGHMIKGKQRVAVINALNSPSTGRKILSIAKQSAPSMTYQDLRHIFRDFQKKGIIACLNPEDQTGRMYLRNTTRENPISRELAKTCARIDRAKTRLAVTNGVLSG
jgi:predicted Zn-ribbon and HTH transcriptional regulator